MKGTVSEKARVCSQETGSLSGGERAVCNSMSLGTSLILQLLLDNQAESPCTGNDPYRAVCQLYVSMGLAFLFVFEGKTHHSCYVG